MIDALSSPLIIPVVLPHSADPSNSGRVRNLPVSPQAVPAWLERRAGGAYAVRGVYADKGYVLLRDLYAAEHNDAGWAKYQRYIVAYQEGKTRSSFPQADLPAEVRKRQGEPLEQDEFADEFNVKPTTGVVAPLPAPRKAKAEAQP